MIDRQDDRQFDLQIRAMLEGAEESVPAQVWEGVSSALGRRRRVVLLRRVAYGFAAAAAVVAGIVVFRGYHSPLVPEETAVYVAEVTEDEVETPAVEVITEVPKEQASLLAVAEPVSKQPLRKASGRDPVVATAGPVVEEEITPAEEKTASLPAETEVPSFDLEHPAADLDVDDNLQPVRSADRITLTAGGLLETNGSPTRSVFTGHRASGTVTPKTGIREHGDNGTYGVPLSLGVGLKWHFAPRWALGTGLTYSYLSRSFTGTYTVEKNGAIDYQVVADITNGIHYLGVPVQLYYSLTGDSPVQCYTFAGASVEKGLVNHFRIQDAGSDIIYKEHVDGVQLSFSVGLGVRFPLTDRIGLYIDPSLHYYPDCDQPRSIRTRQPLMMSLEAGLRFDL